MKFKILLKYFKLEKNKKILIILSLPKLFRRLQVYGVTRNWIEKFKNPESLSRIDNINEFIESLKDFENLEGFLEHVGLVMENISNTSVPTISLMTMHGAKGLEFDYVFWQVGKKVCFQAKDQLMSLDKKD